MGDRGWGCWIQGGDEQGECWQIGMERVFAPEALEAGLGPAAVSHDEAHDDLVDQEGVPRIEEEVELLRLGG
jgi:hypothetical protein